MNIATEKETPLKCIPGSEVAPSSPKPVNEKQFERKAILRQVRKFKISI